MPCPLSPQRAVLEGEPAPPAADLTPLLKECADSLRARTAAREGRDGEDGQDGQAQPSLKVSSVIAAEYAMPLLLGRAWASFDYAWFMVLLVFAMKVIYLNPSVSQYVIYIVLNANVNEA